MECLSKTHKMAKRIDRTGEKYGNWTIIEFYSKYGACDAKWLCKCKCGTEKPVIFRSLASGASTSCGCGAIDARIKKLTKHGYARTRTYKSWHAMHQRCQGKGGHEIYQARNIVVCERWNDFNNFLLDMGGRPPHKTLDRINNDDGYYKENCRWATALQQMNNRHVCKKHTVDGALMTITEAARKYNAGISMVRHRLRKGWSLDRAVKTPSRIP